MAEQIIAALPERIKRAEGDSPSSSSPPPPAPPLSSLEDALMEQMVSLLPRSYRSNYNQIKRLILFDIIFHDIDGDKFILSRMMMMMMVILIAARFWRIVRLVSRVQWRSGIGLGC